MKYECCIREWNGDGNFTEVDGYDVESAAEKHAQNYNEDGDYPLMSNDGRHNSVYVLVREVDKEEITLCVVSAEPDIAYSYYSSEVTKLTCKQCNKDCLADILSGKTTELFDERFCNRNCYLDWLNEYRKENGLPPHPKEAV